MSTPEFQGASWPQQQPNGLATEEVTWAVIAHLSTLIATVLSVGTIGWAAPLILFLVYKDKSAFIRQASAGAFNFALTVFIMYVIGGVFLLVGTFLAWLVVPVLLMILGLIIWVALFVVVIVIPILAALSANRGEAYTYPMTLQVLR